MPAIHEVATLTSKGQITLPKSIRQALGVDTAAKLRSTCAAAKSS
jgi:antitoxin PrlF